MNRTKLSPRRRIVSANSIDQLFGTANVFERRKGLTHTNDDQRGRGACRFATSHAINPFAAELHAKARQSWVEKGGELISFPPDEQAAMMNTLASVGEDVAKSKPELYQAYQLVTEAAKRTRQGPSQ